MRFLAKEARPLTSKQYHSLGLGPFFLVGIFQCSSSNIHENKPIANWWSILYATLK